MAGRALTDVFLIDISEDDENSTSLVVGNDGLTAIKMPAAWTAAGIIVECKIRSDDADWEVAEYVDYASAAKGTDTVVVGAGSVAADKHLLFSPPISGVYAIRICSGAVGAKVAQLADRTIVPAWRRIF